MKKHYDGLEVQKIDLGNEDIITASTCHAEVQLQVLSRLICETNPELVQAEWVGDQG